MSTPSPGKGLLRLSLISPSKWFWTLTPIVLSLSFLSGALVAIDSSQRAVLDTQLADVPVDFVGWGTTNDLLGGNEYLDYNIDYMSNTDGVEEIEPVVVLTYVPVRNSNGDYSPFYTGGHYPVLFLPPDNDRMLESYRINGEMPAPGTIALPKQMADDLDVVAGDTVSLHFQKSVYEYDPETGFDWWSWEEMNVSFTVSEIWTQDGLKTQPVFTQDGGWSEYLDVDEDAVLFRQYLNPAVLNLDDLYPIADGFGDGLLKIKYYEDSETLYLIWVDRDKYVDYQDPSESIARLDGLYGPMSSHFFNFDVSVQRSELVWDLYEWDSDYLGRNRLTFIGLSAPVLVLGVYVTSVGAGVGTDLRDDKIRELSFQGMRRSKIIQKLSFESVIVGLLAGALGLLLGMGVSRILLDPVSSWFAWEYSDSVTGSDYAVSTYTILTVLAMGVSVALLASVFAARKATKSTQAAPSELEPLKWLPITEVLLIGLSLASILTVLGGAEWGGSHGYDWYFSSPSIFFQYFGLAAFPAVPFMLSLGVVNILTKWPVFAHRRLAGTQSPKGQSVTLLAGPVTERCEKRARRMCVLVALTLALTVFLTILTDTIVARNEEAEYYDDWESRPLAQFLSFEVTVSMLMMMVGVAFASYANARATMSSPYLMSVKDKGRDAIRDTLSKEAVMLSVVGSIVGVSVGLLTAFLFGMMWDAGFGPNQVRGLILTLGVVGIIAISVVLLLVVTFAFSRLGSRARNMKPGLKVG